jgi:uncharacterized MnhB-related membrane protein
MKNDLIFISIAIALGFITLALSLIAIHYKKLSVAILAMGIVSLFTSVLFLLLAAPDVAMTEAAIGSGLSTLIFFFVLNKIKRPNV